MLLSICESDCIFTRRQKCKICRCSGISSLFKNENEHDWSTWPAIEVLGRSSCYSSQTLSIDRLLFWAQIRELPEPELRQKRGLSHQNRALHRCQWNEGSGNHASIYSLFYLFIPRLNLLTNLLVLNIIVQLWVHCDRWIKEVKTHLLQA